MTTDSGYLTTRQQIMSSLLYAPSMKTPPTHLIAKSNLLVESAYKMTLAEQRLLLAVATEVDTHPDKPGVTGETPIEITAGAIGGLFTLPTKEAYELLQDAADRLYDRSVIIEYPDPNPDDPDLTRTKTRWVSAISYLPARGSVRLYLAPKIIPYMNKLSGEFTRYRLQYVAPMTSVYAIRLYELLIKWQMTGEREVQIDWIKKQFMIPDSYSRIVDLKKRVIQPAVDQINEHSNLWVKYSQKKAGRKVVALQFQFGLKDNERKTLKGPPARASGPRKDPGPAPEQGRLPLDAPAHSPAWTPAPADALADRPKGRRAAAEHLDALKARLKGGKAPDVA
jgi:plasmid replication initiation protein